MNENKTENTVKAETVIRKNSLKAWILATRPQTLTGAIIPVLIACALTLDNETFQALPALFCMLFAGLMQIAANMINDLCDFLKGSDREDRLGPPRACAQGWISPTAMKAGIFVVIFLACLAGLGLLFVTYQALPFNGLELIAIGLLCIVFAFLYTTHLSYLGWGDVLVLIFFGFVPVGGTYYVQAHTLTSDVLVASLISGLLIDTLLVVNNYRDREQDLKSGKRTLIVIMGEKFGSYLYLALGIAVTLLSLWFASETSDEKNILTPIAEFVRQCLTPTWHNTVALIPIFYILAHVSTWRKMTAIGKGKELNSILGETSRNMLLMGLLLSAMILL